jgi:hypothetical protein
MTLPATIARVGFSLALREGMMHRTRAQERERMYECACHRANETRRPLVTIEGDCDCHVGCKEYADDSCVILVCYSLETLPEKDDQGQPGLESAWREIMRVAGSSSNIFVAHHKGSLVSMVHPSMNWKIESAPPLSPGLAYRSRKKIPYVGIKRYW